MKKRIETVVSFGFKEVDYTFVCISLCEMVRMFRLSNLVKIFEVVHSGNSENCRLPISEFANTCCAPCTAGDALCYRENK